MSPITLAIAHQKGGVGKSTTAALLAYELSLLRPDWQIGVSDEDPDHNLSSRWPGDTDRVHLVRRGRSEYRLDLHLVDTGPGNPRDLGHLLGKTDAVIVPVRMEAMSTQALGLFVPRLREVQAENGGRPRLLGLVLTHYSSRVSSHAAAREALERWAARNGTGVLGTIPWSAQVGQLSTRGRLYRPVAEVVAALVEEEALVTT